MILSWISLAVTCGHPLWWLKTKNLSHMFQLFPIWTVTIFHVGGFWSQSVRAPFDPTSSCLAGNLNLSHCRHWFTMGNLTFFATQHVRFRDPKVWIWRLRWRHHTPDHEMTPRKRRKVYACPHTTLKSPVIWWSHSSYSSCWTKALCCTVWGCEESWPLTANLLGGLGQQWQGIPTSHWRGWGPQMSFIEQSELETTTWLQDCLARVHGAWHTFSFTLCFRIGEWERRVPAKAFVFWKPNYQI